MVSCTALSFLFEFRFAITARFKLYLRPQHTETPTDDFLPRLPLNKTVEQVFGDFLRYLFECTRQYIQETHAGGAELWKNMEDDVEFVLTHPNSWEGTQQAQMRTAVVYAGLIPDSRAGHARIHFMTEGEATLYFCVRNNHLVDIVKVSSACSFFHGKGPLAQPLVFDRAAKALSLLMWETKSLT